MRVAGSCAVMMAVAISGCRSPEAGSVKPDPELAALVSHDAVVLVGARVEALRATALYKKWAARKWSFEPDGLDFRKDLREVLAASNGKDTLVLAKGKFSPAEMEAKLEKSGARKTEYRGRTLVGTQEAAVVFLNSSTAAAGSAAALRAMIDQKERSGGGIPEKLLEQTSAIPAANQIWAAALGSNPLVVKAIPETGNLANLRRIVASVETATLGIDARSGLKMDARMACRSEQDAKFIHDGLRGLIGMGRLSVPDDEPEMLRFYDSIAVVQRESSVRVEADIPMDVLEKFTFLRREPREPH